MNAPDFCKVVLLAVFLAGCATGPLPPEWQSNAHGALKSFSAAYLSGKTQAAERDFARARSEITSTGRADLVARAELVRCATRVASLEFDDCAGFQPLARDAGAAERAYAEYLAGRWQNLDPALLPAHHRALLAAAGANANRLGGIDDPLARLVAAGALLQNGRLTPADIATATETASAQGWRRPLLAWLEVQARRAREGGDGEAAARIQRRIELVSQAPR